MRKLALAVLMVSGVAIGVVGCGGSSPRKQTTGTAGKGGAGGSGAAGTGAAGTGAAGTGAAGTGAAGDTGTAGAAGGAAGAAGGTAGAGGAAGAAAGATGAAGTPLPPPITSTTTVLEIDDVIVSLKSTDGGVDAAADGGVDAAADGGVDSGTVDGGADASDASVSQAVSYKFPLNVDGWHYTSYGSTPPGPPSADNYASTSMLAWTGTDDADGVTTSGALKGTVPFQHDNDQIDFQAFTNGAGMYNWTGYIINAKIKLVSGGNLKHGCPLTAVLYVSDNNMYMTRLSGPVDLVLGQWVSVAFDMADANINVAGISQMGIQVYTGPFCQGTPDDGGTDANADGGVADAPVDHAADAPVDAAADVAADVAAIH